MSDLTRWGRANEESGLLLCENDDGYWTPWHEAKEQITALTDKAIRFDLDQAGIERREAEAVELVELRAQVSALKARLEALGMHADELAAELKEAQV